LPSIYSAVSLDPQPYSAVSAAEAAAAVAAGIAPEKMTKPERIRDDWTETEKEAKKKRNSLGEELEVDPPLCDPPEMRGVGGSLLPHHDCILYWVFTCSCCDCHQ
jgi:hypothetical protein